MLVPIAPLPPRAAGELLTLQRAAYVDEAQRYDDPRLPPLVQTLAELREEQQGRGIGSRLLAAAEAGTTLRRATLFTGARSEPNLRLYRRHGYVESHRATPPSGPQLVHLVKDLA